MKKLLLLPVVLLAFAVSGFAGEAKVPDLTGIWTGQYAVARHDGFGHSKLSVDIVSQSDELLKGHMDWKRIDFTPDVPGNMPKLDYGRSKFAAVVNFDGKTIAFADQADGAIVRGILTGPNTMRIILVKGNNPAVAFRATLTRVAKQ